jgi:DNA uptake protein ComE-like DNA-binding protein
MKPFQFFFRFTKDQRKGILALFILVIVFQIGCFIAASVDFNTKKDHSVKEKEWLALQLKIEAIKRKSERKDTIYPFDPNYISDYKGYVLGLSAEHIDRLNAFRKTGRYINSAADFRKVTGVPDTLLSKLSPYFKFPGWVAGNGSKLNGQKAVNEKQTPVKAVTAVVVLDINTAIEEDLVKVYGIGPYFAKELLRRRADLGAFVSMDQMDDFERFSAEAVAGLKKNFKVDGAPEVNKINVNTASLQQLSHFPYFNKDVARAIITQRSMNGKITKTDELLKITGFPVDKLKIIALYLEF